MHVSGGVQQLTKGGIALRVILILGLVLLYKVKSQWFDPFFKNECPNAYQKQVIEPLTLQGVIVQKHFTESHTVLSQGRHLKTLQVQQKGKLAEVQDWGEGFNNFYQTAEVNDSVRKEYGTTAFYLIKRNGDQLKFEFNCVTQ